MIITMIHSSKHNNNVNTHDSNDNNDDNNIYIFIYIHTHTYIYGDRYRLPDAAVPRQRRLPGCGAEG